MGETSTQEWQMSALVSRSARACHCGRRLILERRNLKPRCRQNLTTESKENGRKEPKIWVSQNNRYIEYCAMDNLSGKLQFMI
jgi:hypothetical protein